MIGEGQGSWLEGCANGEGRGWGKGQGCGWHGAVGLEL